MDEAEKDELLDQMNAASKAGDMALFVELTKKMPVPVEVAIAFRNGFGVEFIKNSGFNYSEVEENLGPNWLDE